LEQEESHEVPLWRASVFRHFLMAQASWLTSAAVHLALLLILAIIVLPEHVKPDPQITTLCPDDDAEVPEEYEVQPFEITTTLITAALVGPVEIASLEPELDEEVAAPDFAFDPGESDLDPGALIDPLATIGTLVGDLGNGDGTGGIGDRGRRRGRALDIGATPPSEKAVSLALLWLAAHQSPNGSWNFDHDRGNCGGRCANPGTATPAVNAATALGVMPFLGAGETHLTGEYRHVVAAALNFLIRNQKSDGSFHEPEGRMYAHGLATLALCEAYAMQRSLFPGERERANREARRKRTLAVNPQALAAAAQAGVNFIQRAQHSEGGWRYDPGQPGDMSIVGWQVMALKSGHLADLRIDPRTVARVNRFLDSVAADQYGSRFGYMTSEPKPSTTSIGLLCRMYMGLAHEDPGLAGGVEYLSNTGPSKRDMYYDYYATQVMHHYGGPLWDKWNEKMRDYLAHTQSRTGHQAGSWHFADPHGALKGGRLYCTALAAMILEIYYRNQPIYRASAVEDDFVL